MAFWEVELKEIVERRKTVVVEAANEEAAREAAREEPGDKGWVETDWDLEVESVWVARPGKRP